MLRILICLGFILPGAVQADVLASKSRKSLFQSQTGVLDSRASQRAANAVSLQPTSFVTPTKWATEGPAYDGRYRGQFLASAKAAARRHGVPEGLFLRLIEQESRWNPAALSHKGAVGLAQLMPATAARLAVNPKDPNQNLEGGARYLKAQYMAFRSWKLALAAYNAGPGAVQKYGGIPPYAETQNYVKVIYRGE